MKIRFFILAAVALARTAYSQSEARQETLENLSSDIQDEAAAQQVAFRATAPELGEIGLVQRQPAPDTFTFFTAQNVFYTDNAFLLDDFKLDSWAYSGRFGVTYVPWSVRDWTPSISVDQTFFRYDRVSVLDFNVQSITFALKYDITRDESWTATAAYSLTRIFTPRLDAGDVYKYGTLNLSLNHVRQLGERGVSPFFFSGSFAVSLRNGDPTAFDRVDLDLPLTLIYTPFERAQIFASFRPSVQFYTNDPVESDRRDLNLLAAVGVSYQFASWFSVGANYSWTGNYSNAAFRDYEVNMPGFSVTGKISF